MAKVPIVLLLVETSRGFGRSLLTGVAEYVRFHAPWSVYTYPPFFRISGESRKLLTRMKKMGIDGIIAREMSEISQIKQMRIPAIFASTIEPKKGLVKHSFPIITTDNAAVTAMAVEHLLDRGFTNFAYCGYDDIEWSQLRGRLFAKELSKYGHQCRFYKQPRTKRERLWENELPILSEWLKTLAKPTGLMTCCDDRSQNIVEAAKLAGICIPEEIAVLGVDDDELICHLANPPLSSVGLAVRKAGQEAARLLDALMAGRAKMTGQKIIISPTRVRTRHSTDVLAVDEQEVAVAMRFIREHIRRRIQVDDVADATCLSRRSLERRFRKTLGRSVQHEINRIRADQIKTMLAQTNMSILEIAHAMGYHSLDNMRRFFHRQTGRTPLGYRRQLCR